MWECLIKRGAQTSLNWSAHELQPYVIELKSERGTWRVHRHFQSINNLNLAVGRVLAASRTLTWAGWRMVPRQDASFVSPLLWEPV